MALDEAGKPVPVPPLIVKTSEERRRYREAGERRNLRLKARKKNVRWARLSLLPLFSVLLCVLCVERFYGVRVAQKLKAFNTENTEEHREQRS